jgi:ubiquinone/menaquinone biosynthesis C-methylase UbiE
MSDQAGDRLKAEFNQWALAGKGESMARHHRAIAERTLERMKIATGDRVLDLGCGSGWACRMLAPAVGPRGLVVGVDISDEMIREAQQNPENPPNTRFLCSPAEHIPWAPDFFTHVLSVESFYYYEDQRVVLDELKRLLIPDGKIFLLICLFTESPGSREWVERLQVPVHVRSAKEYKQLLTDAGWRSVAVERFTPAPGDDDPHAHALLITARK